MSDYHHEKVLRVPFMKYHNHFQPDESDPNDVECYTDDFGYWIEEKYPDKFRYGEKGYFQLAPTDEQFIDFVLKSDYDEDGDWGKVRVLSKEEQEAWKPVFEKIIPTIDMDDVHLVEFCWYNCCEAPDYYSLEPEDDPFYRPLLDPAESVKFK